MIGLFKEVFSGSKEVAILAKGIAKETQEVRRSMSKNGYILDDLCQELDSHNSGLGIGCPQKR